MCILVRLGSGGAVEEISLIKNLLTTIFDRYKSDMTSLHQLVEITTGDLKRYSACLFAALKCPLHNIIMVRDGQRSREFIYSLIMAVYLET